MFLTGWRRDFSLLDYPVLGKPFTHQGRREALLQAVTDGKASSGGTVKAKRHGPQFSEFAADTRDTIGHMGDEYKDLKGDILRDMLGGSVTAARTWLESKGDPDTYHAGTGWTPLLMAVSTGNMELVELLISYRASLTLPAKGSGETCAHLAVYKTTSEMLHKVLDVHGPATKEVRNDGSTALSLAVEKGSSTCEERVHTGSPRKARGPEREAERRLDAPGPRCSKQSAACDKINGCCTWGHF